MRFARFTALVAVLLALALGLAGCGSGSSSATTTGATSTSVAPTSTAASTAGSATATTGNKVWKIGISYLVANPALDLTRQGLKDALKAAGYVEGQNVSYQEMNAQGDTNNALTIAQTLAAGDVDVIVAQTTPCAQAVVKAIREKPKPLIFVNVSNPVGAGMFTSVDQPTKAGFSGVYNFDPVAEQMKLIVQFLPQGKKVGVIYNAGESNSVTNVKGFKVAAAAAGWTVVEATVANSSEVQMASRTFVGKVDAVYMPQDNTVVTALEALIKTCQDAKLPLFVADTESVKRGAIATVGNDQTDTGVQAGEMLVRVLKGENAGDITPEVVRKRVVEVNKTAAKLMGVAVPQAVLDSAQVVIP
jgi:putative tryptophan/tyrosine transport system substrate-binding protein